MLGSGGWRWTDVQVVCAAVLLSALVVTAGPPPTLDSASEWQACDAPGDNCDGTLKIEYPLSGTVPTTIGFMTSIIRIKLSETGIVGPIPTEIGLATSLIRIDLYSNGLTSSIPTELGMLSDTLTRIRVSYNSLQGTLPTELASLTLLERLLVQFNEALSGTIPTGVLALGSFTALDNHIDFRNTSMCGPDLFTAVGQYEPSLPSCFPDPAPPPSPPPPSPAPAPEESSFSWFKFFFKLRIIRFVLDCISSWKS